MRALSTGMLVLLALAARVAPARAQSSYEDLQAFSGLLNQIRLNYVDSVGYRNLVHGAIDGVLRSLDPHSYYLSSADMERRSSYEAGMLAGTGIVLDDIDGDPVILGMAPGSPAMKAGILPGDRLLSINDSSVSGLSIETLHTRMIGDKGTRLRVGLERGLRGDPRRFTVSLKLAIIPARSVAFSKVLPGGAGYIRLSHFYPGAGKEMKDALGKVGNRVPGVVLDLRGNPGGNLGSAVEIAELFLRKDVDVMRLKGRTRIDNQSFRTEKDGPYMALPLIVLVNEQSASAAEVLAGTFQDLDRAVIVGRRTFGKALAQRPIPLPPRGDVVYLTVARVLTPSGRVIQRPYDKLTAEQYEQQAGTGGTSTDTTQRFKSAGGRVVYGGGGVLPDVVVPARPELPAWWVASSSDWVETLVDSVAYTLDAVSLDRWKVATEEWRTRLLTPLLAGVTRRMGIEPRPDSAGTARLARILAYRSIEVRWGTDAANEFIIGSDEEIATAVAQIPRVAEVLKAPQ